MESFEDISSFQGTGSWKYSLVCLVIKLLFDFKARAWVYLKIFCRHGNIFSPILKNSTTFVCFSQTWKYFFKCLCFVIKALTHSFLFVISFIVYGMILEMVLHIFSFNRFQVHYVRIPEMRCFRETTLTLIFKCLPFFLFGK